MQTPMSKQAQRSRSAGPQRPKLTAQRRKELRDRRQYRENAEVRSQEAEVCFRRWLKGKQEQEERDPRVLRRRAKRRRDQQREEQRWQQRSPRFVASMAPSRAPVSPAGTEQARKPDSPSIPPGGAQVFAPRRPLSPKADRTSGHHSNGRTVRGHTSTRWLGAPPQLDLPCTPLVTPHVRELVVQIPAGSPPRGPSCEPTTTAPCGHESQAMGSPVGTRASRWAADRFVECRSDVFLCTWCFDFPCCCGDR